MSFNDSTTSYQNYRPTTQARQEIDEFESVHNVVFQNLVQLKTNFDNVSQMAKDIGTFKDNSSSREQLKSLMNRTTIIIKESQQYLSKLTNLIGVGDARKRNERKLLVEKWTSDFSKFTETYAHLAAVAKEKLEDVPLTSKSYSSGNNNNNPFDEDNARYNQQESAQYHMKQQQLSRLQADREFQDALIHDRDQEIRAIQGQMSEINEIFKNVATLVDEQGELVDDIRSNISSANSNVVVAVHEVQEAEKLQEGVRNKLLWLAGCCIIMVIAVVVIVVVVVKMREK